MKKYADKVVSQAKAWLGRKESDNSFREIIDTYNTLNPLPRGYKMTYTAPWCAAFVTAVAVKLGYTDIIPPECSCGRMIDKLKAMDCWQESDSHVPAPGELLFYDWEDTGSGENTGSADHVGIVESVQNGMISVIEGNYSNSVKRRTLAVNGRYIRGFGVPKYDTQAAEAPRQDFTLAMTNLKNGSRGEAVRALQILLMGRGYSCGSSGADGVFGNDTHSALVHYQKAACLTADGIAGKNTMTELLGVS